MKFQLLVFTLFICLSLPAQQTPFRFAFVTDTHIGSPNGAAEEDLRRTVQDINEQKDIAFVLLTGDITELGTHEELLLAKKILDSLNVLGISFLVTMIPDGAKVVDLDFCRLLEWTGLVFHLPVYNLLVAHPVLMYE